MTRIACVVIASAKRHAPVWRKVVPYVLAQSQPFDEIVVVGDWTPLAGECPPGVRYLCMEPLLHTTTDALVKRDCGTIATTSDILCYLCDDHAPGSEFAAAVAAVAAESWDVIVPNRYTTVDGVRVSLNNGEAHGYCGGHAGVFRRDVIHTLPWTAGPHDRLWDVTMSRAQQALGARFVYHPRAEIEVEDLEPETKPWL